MVYQRKRRANTSLQYFLCVLKPWTVGFLFKDWIFPCQRSRKNHLKTIFENSHLLQYLFAVYIKYIGILSNSSLFGIINVRSLGTIDKIRPECQWQDITSTRHSDDRLKSKVLCFLLIIRHSASVFNIARILNLIFTILEHIDSLITPAYDVLGTRCSNKPIISQLPSFRIQLTCNFFQ